MIINDLELHDFRNYAKQKIIFSDKTNIIYGNNAQGKTNILESIYLFGYGKSHRTKYDSEMVRFTTEFSKINIGFESHGRHFDGKMIFDKSGKKTITLNNVPVPKLSRLMQYLHVVLFSPDDLTLVKGSPSNRRKFMDRAISQMNPSYLTDITAYQKIILQKNFLLKTLKKNKITHDEVLSVYNEQLSIYAEKIMKFRHDFVLGLSKYAVNIQNDISEEKLEISYTPNLNVFTEKEINTFLEKNQQKEIENGSSKYGIGRDDIVILINGLDSRLFCSQGQQRTAVLSLKIAQADYVYSVTDEYPILLLDDIMSELDISRRMYLWEKITDKQVIITCTDTDIFDDTGKAKLFYVKDNKVDF